MLGSNALPLASDRPQRPGRTWLRAARIIHPFPTVLNVLATLGLACVAARGVPPGGVLARMLALMFFAQSAIGVTNDYFDRELDAATKPWKPVASGLVTPAAAAGLALTLIAATVAIGATLGVASLLLAMLGLACGLAYDARLKRSMFSAVTYMIAIPTLPLWVWATLGAWQRELLWLIPLGALIGLALHLQNTLADLDDDAAHGVRGLAHMLGRGRSMVLGWCSFALALLISVALIPFIEYEMRWYAPAAAIGAACLAVSTAAYARRRDAATAQLGFGLLGIASALLATGWLAAVTSP